MSANRTRTLHVVEITCGAEVGIRGNAPARACGCEATDVVSVLRAMQRTSPQTMHFPAYGLLLEARLGMEETVFEIGSLTKVFTALALADMVRRGEVGLDDPVAYHLPNDFHLPVVEGRQITLADLPTHTSGLPPVRPFPGDPQKYGVEDFKAWLSDLHPRHPAGAMWEYTKVVGYTLPGVARPIAAITPTRLSCRHE